LARLEVLRNSGALRFQVGQVTGIATEDGRLTTAQITDVDGNTAALPVDNLLVLLGLSPRLGPLSQWGLVMERKQLQVDTEKFSTSIPGIFAVGDINTYPGKKKLILCGFHEATLAAYAAAELIFPGQKIPFQYTTTSPKLHKLLGVETL
jgi:thioredoxin reductase (NADPH)